MRSQTPNRQSRLDRVHSHGRRLMVELNLELEPRLEAGGHARQYLAERLRDQLGDALDPLLAGVSELVNNAVLYGPGEPIQVCIAAHPDGRVIGEVHDQ